MKEKRDIVDRTDVEELVDSFYVKIKASEIAYIFTDVANVDWQAHMPVMYNFWCSLLLGEASYKDNAMLKHIELSRKTTLDSNEFSVWLNSFIQTVDELFEGPMADEAKSRATQIAKLMEFKIQQEYSGRGW